MGMPRFYETTPAVEIRKDIAFIGADAERCVCMSVETLRCFHRRIGAALAMLDFPPNTNVVGIAQGDRRAHAAIP